MKFVILLALVVIAAAQQHRRDDDHGDALHNLIHEKVTTILRQHPQSTTAQCATQCENLFDVNGGHDEKVTNHLCVLECAKQISQPVGGGPGAGEK